MFAEKGLTANMGFIFAGKLLSANKGFIFAINIRLGDLKDTKSVINVS